MKKVTLLGIDIPYGITKKRNKNTYFYFKKDGYIQINLSRYQREKDAITFLHNNAESFVKKYQSIQKNHQKRTSYHLWGIPYHTTKTDQSEFDISMEKQTLIYNPSSIDHVDKLKQFDKQQMLQMLQQLHKKYQAQTLVSLDNVNYYTNYTTSRHGSCNPSKRQIRISTHLVRLDPIYTEYVYCHEIAHLKVSNHSKEFYAVLEQLLPNYKVIRQQLKEVW